MAGILITLFIWIILGKHALIVKRKALGTTRKNLKIGYWKAEDHYLESVRPFICAGMIIKC
ncbi:hypothetical protein A7K69_04225 [Parageobacillus thermoglucosidasius]|uniref:Uncharacterized protein n=1 Tax=Parageobacillus thermoglucosidasius TaxID=1426 RepID=A0A1B7KT04_PARTM|nr:hypothetical protein A7K69_04225 [Parageobacillus thermoglucosidasius]